MRQINFNKSEVKKYKYFSKIKVAVYHIRYILGVTQRRISGRIGFKTATMSTMDSYPTYQDVVMSIKPKYSDKIIEGRKTAELRRRFPVSSSVGTTVYIYATSPQKAIIGTAQIANVHRLPVEQIWDKFSEKAFIDRVDFEKYFDGLEQGIALILDNVIEFPNPFPLAELREKYNFQPPQSFSYAKGDLLEALKDGRAIVSH